MARLSLPFQGFTLPELLVVIALAGIITAAGLPSLRDAISNSRRTSSINALVADMNLARSEAIKRGEQVTICKSSNGTSCDTTGISPYSWDIGWLIFADNNGDAIFDDDGDTTLCELVDDCMLRKQAALDLIELTFGQQRITYSVRGTTTGSGTFIFCDDRGDSSARGKVLFSSGRLRTYEGSLTCP